MAQFDVYRSVGPNVEVSLFGDAATKGAALGKAIPSFVQTAIEGTQEGYKYGQERQAQSQINEIRQHQIDRQATEDAQQDALRAAQLKNAEATATVNGLEAQVATQNEDLFKQAKIAELEAARAKNSAVAQQLARRDAFNKEYATASPERQAEMGLGNEFRDVLGSDRELEESVLSSMLRNPSVGQSAKDSIAQQLKFKTIESDQAKIAREQLPNFIKARTELLQSPLTDEITNSGLLPNIPVEQYPQNTKFRRAGEYEVDPDTNTVKKNPDGTWRRNTNRTDDAVNGDKWDVFSLDGKLIVSGKKDFQGLTVDGKQQFSTYITQLEYQNGAQLKKAIDYQRKLDETASGNGGIQGSQAAVGGVDDIPRLGSQRTPDKAIDLGAPVAPRHPVVQALEGKLNLGESEIAALGSSIKDLERYTRVYTDFAQYRNSPEAQIQLDKTTTDMARSISDARFDSDIAVRQEYTPEKVSEWNATMMRKSMQLVSNDPVGAALSGAINDPDASIYSAFRVNSPKDLYFKDQQATLEKTINKTLIEVLTRQQAKVDQPVRTQVTRNKNVAILMQQFAGTASSGQ